MATPSRSFILQGEGHPSGFPLPPHDYVAKTYIAAGAADNDDVATEVFKQGGASGVTVATLTYTYVGSTNNVATVTLSVP